MKKIILSIVAIATLASCQIDDVKVDNWNGEILLASGVEVLQTRSNSGTVPDTQIANKQKIGVFINEKDDDTNPVISTNLTYTANGSGTLTLGGTQPYYPQSGNDVKIYAYHPFVASITDSHTHTVATDQSTDVSYYNADLLYSESMDYVRQKEVHNLTFTHKLSKIVCNLTAGSGTPTVAGATVEVMGVAPSTTFTHADGAIGAASGNRVNVKLNSTITSGSYIGIVPPQSFGTEKFLKVTLASGGVLYYTLGSILIVENGKVYTYNITVNLTSLSVSSTINDWKTVGTVNGNAEM